MDFGILKVVFNVNVAPGCLDARQGRGYGAGHGGDRRYFTEP